MRNAVIVDSVRTGLAKSFRGGFNMTRPDDMLAHIINAMLERNPNLPPEAVEDVIMGCGNPEGAQGHNVGRNAAVLSNLPMTVGGTTVNRYCSSGLQTVSMAASQVMAGCYDTVIAGGAETISMLQGKMNMDNFVNEKLKQFPTYKIRLPENAANNLKRLISNFSEFWYLNFIGVKVFILLLLEFCIINKFIK